MTRNGENITGRAATNKPPHTAGEYVEGILRGDHTLLSRAITLIESTKPAHQALAQEILDGCLPGKSATGHLPSSIRIGITGAPGVGKSTFIETLGTYLTGKGHKVAVLAVDPTSQITKGSILGDKTRMIRLSADANAFIRPSPERFRENSFTGNDVGLLLAPSVMLGPQTHKGNMWSGTFGSYGAQHLSTIPSDWASSQFTVHTGTSGTYRPTLPTGQSTWFPVDPSGSPSESCELITSCIVELPPMSFNDDKLLRIDSQFVSGSLVSTDFEEVSNWLSKRYLYRRLKSYPGLVDSGSAFETFVNNSADSTYGKFYEIEAGMNELYELPGATEAQLTENFDSLGARMEEIGVLDSILYYTGSDSLLLVERASLLGKAQEIEALSDSLMQEVLAQRALDADTLNLRNWSIGGSLTLEQNERLVNRIFLSTVAVGVTEFTEQELDYLQDVASQCPLTGGSAVFKARSLLAMVQDSIYDDSTLCDGLEEREAKIH